MTPRRKSTRERNQPRILVVGGTSDAHDVSYERIDCDFKSIIAGPPGSSYEDFDFVVFCPNKQAFLLPPSHQEWEVFRKNNPGRLCYPSVTQDYWRFRPRDTHRILDLEDTPSLIRSSNMAAKHFSSGYAQQNASSDPINNAAPRLLKFCASETDAVLLERLLWWRCCQRLRRVVLSMTMGTVVVVVLPEVPFDTKWCCAWLSPLIEESPSRHRAVPRRHTEMKMDATFGSLARHLVFQAEAPYRRLSWSLLPEGEEEPIPQCGQHQLENLVLKAEDFTLTTPMSSTVFEAEPGWGHPVFASVWPPTGVTEALLLDSGAGGAIVCAAEIALHRMPRCLRHWHEKRQGDDSGEYDLTWSKSVFRKAGPRLWEVKIAEEAPTPLANSKGCEYIWRILQREGREMGIRATVLHASERPSDVAGVPYGGVPFVGEKGEAYSKLDLGSRIDVTYSEKLKKRRAELKAEIAELEEQPVTIPEDQEALKGLREELSIIAKKLIDSFSPSGRIRLIRSKGAESARISVHNAIHRVIKKIEESGAELLAEHLREHIQTGDTLRYSGNHDWKTE